MPPTTLLLRCRFSDLWSFSLTTMQWTGPLPLSAVPAAIAEGATADAGEAQAAGAETTAAGPLDLRLEGAAMAVVPGNEDLILLYGGRSRGGWAGRVALAMDGCQAAAFVQAQHGVLQGCTEKHPPNVMFTDLLQRPVLP